MAEELPVPPPPEDLPGWSEDKQARLEEKNWDNEDKLRGQKVANDIIWLKVYGLLIVVVTVVFTALFLASLVIWSVHYLTPYGWLNPEQLSKIQSVIFSGSLGAIVSTVLQKQLQK
ncbi:MAG: hypothetical protein WDZ54_08410 [Sneathiella sp.]